MDDKEKRELIAELRDTTFGERPPIQLEAANALEATLWRPIEEAPDEFKTDGTPIVAVCDDGGVHGCSYWTVNRLNEETNYSEPFKIDDEYWCAIEDDYPVNPTHFKPLDTPETE